MKRDKLLAEWFWTDRWTGSDGQLLPLHHRGLYREMLTQAWKRGGKLPNDPEAIRRLCAVTEAEWRRSWPVVEKFWRVDGADLVNDTQAEVYADAQASRERARAHARGAARARHEQSPGSARADARATARAVPGECPPSPSPSPSQRKTDNGVTELRPAPPPAVVALAKPGPKAWSREACDDWIARYGGTAPGGVIGKSLEALVRKHGWERVRPAWQRYLGETEAEYVSAPRFASTFGHWAGGMALVRRSEPPSPKDLRKRGAMAALITGGIKGDGTLPGGSHD